MYSFEGRSSESAPELSNQDCMSCGGKHSIPGSADVSPIQSLLGARIVSIQKDGVVGNVLGTDKSFHCHWVSLRLVQDVWCPLGP